MLRMFLLRDGFCMADHGGFLLRGRVGGWPIVWYFRLDLAHEDILCVGELVLIQRVVLDRRAYTRVVNRVS